MKFKTKPCKSYEDYLREDQEKRKKGGYEDRLISNALLVIRRKKRMEKTWGKTVEKALAIENYNRSLTLKENKNEE